MAKKASTESNSNPEYSAFVVASIDILGQREFFEEFNDMEKVLLNFEKYSLKVQHAHKHTFDKVLKLRNDFAVFFNNIQESDAADHVPMDKKKIVSALRKVHLNQFNFSDTIIAYTSFGIGSADYFANVINGIYAILGSCGLFAFSSLAEGKPFRAGVSFGLGAEIKDDARHEVYGPALYQAYKLENEKAQYPRVVISRQLVKCLMKVQEGRVSDFKSKEDETVSRGLAEICLNFVSQDFDGQFFLDYLGPGFQKLFDDFDDQGKKHLEELYERALDFIKKEHRKWMAKGNQKLAARYFFLLNYFLLHEDIFHK
ncbi:MAG: hypothetical protein ACOC2M_02600 [bacterium]